MKSGEIWYMNFPFEENETQTIQRPSIIVAEVDNQVVAIKVTKHDPRENDPFDVKIEYWKEAGLSVPSTARISKTKYIDKSQILNRKGELHPSDIECIAHRLKEYLDTLED
jgi:mRNA-degrading endonuclease toxin of MazEF toxin-antitoxin module